MIRHKRGKVHAYLGQDEQFCVVDWILGECKGVIRV